MKMWSCFNKRFGCNISIGSRKHVSGVFRGQDSNSLLSYRLAKILKFQKKKKRNRQCRTKTLIVLRPNISYRFSLGKIW